MEKRRTIFDALVEHRVGNVLETIPLRGESLTDIYNHMQNLFGVSGRKVEREVIILDKEAISKERDRVIKEYKKLRKKTVNLLHNEILKKIDHIYGDSIYVEDLEDAIYRVFGRNMNALVADMVKHGDTRFGHIETETFEVVSLKKTEYITEYEHVVKNRQIVEQQLL